jgi:hypothetical protein
MTREVPCPRCLARSGGVLSIALEAQMRPSDGPDAVTDQGRVAQPEVGNP